MNDEINLDIDKMYYAGRVRIPNTAIDVRDVATSMADHLQTFDQQAALAGDPAVMRDLLSAGQVVYDQLCRAVTMLDRSADAVVATANDFLAHDEDARRDLSDLTTRLRHADVPRAEAPRPLGDLSDPGATSTEYNPNRPGVPTPTTTHTPSTPAPIDPDTDSDNRSPRDDPDYGPVGGGGQK